MCKYYHHEYKTRQVWCTRFQELGHFWWLVHIKFFIRWKKRKNRLLWVFHSHPLYRNPIGQSYNLSSKPDRSQALYHTLSLTLSTYKYLKTCHFPKHTFQLIIYGKISSVHSLPSLGNLDIQILENFMYFGNVGHNNGEFCQDVCQTDLAQSFM